MPRQLSRLTALKVAKLTKPGLHGDGGGLTLQITKAGNKSWLFRYMRDGKARAMGLGPTHSVTLAEARVKALDARKVLLDDKDPLDEKRQRKLKRTLDRAKQLTFDQCAAAYIAAHKASWKNPKHADQWTNTLKTYASPKFGQFPVSEIDTAMVVRCLSPIWETKTETASRLRGRIESVLDWATTSGHRKGENPARWRGHLDNLLANISKTSRTRNHPSLPWEKIQAFMASLSLRDGISHRALEFAVLTACRSGEIRGAQWAEFDFEERLWTIPAARMKAKREHLVPLSSKALTLLKQIKTEQHANAENDPNTTSTLVFPGRKGQVLSDATLTSIVRRMNSEVEKPIWVDKDGNCITAHGFRATFRMWVAENTAYPREVAEHALAHQLPDLVERAYQRGSMLKKREEMMEAWARFCTQKVKKPTRANSQKSVVDAEEGLAAYFAKKEANRKTEGVANHAVVDLIRRDAADGGDKLVLPKIKQ